MKINKTYIFILLGFSFMLSSCVKIGEFYLGLNMQPNMEKSPYVAGLNVFGMLKTGPNLDTINHFFEVQRMIDLSTWDEETVVPDATIQLTRTTFEGNQSFYYPEHLNDGLYFDRRLKTVPGDKWDFICTVDTFKVSSSCIVPNIPIIEQKIEVSIENGYSFIVKADSTAFMYFIYILQEENFHIEKIVPGYNEQTVVNIKPEWVIKSGTSIIYVFAFDKNLREYNTTSNTLFKPNAFRPSFSTVEGGYGSFGAITSCMEIVQN